MKAAETSGTALLTGVSGGIGAVFADPGVMALRQVEQRVSLFPAVRQAMKRTS